MVVIRGSGLSVLLLPPGDVLQLASLSLGKVVRELGLLQGMPVVEHPVWGNHLALERTATGTLSDCKEGKLEREPARINPLFTFLRLVVRVVEQLLLAGQHQLVCQSHILDVLVLVKAVTHQTRMVPEDVPGWDRIQYGYIRGEFHSFSNLPPVVVGLQLTDGLLIQRAHSSRVRYNGCGHGSGHNKKIFWPDLTRTPGQ